MVLLSITVFPKRLIYSIFNNNIVTSGFLFLGWFLAMKTILVLLKY